MYVHIIYIFLYYICISHHITIDWHIQSVRPGRRKAEKATLEEYNRVMELQAILGSVTAVAVTRRVVRMGYFTNQYTIYIYYILYSYIIILYYIFTYKYIYIYIYNVGSRLVRWFPIVSSFQKIIVYRWIGRSGTLLCHVFLLIVSSPTHFFQLTVSIVLIEFYSKYVFLFFYSK